MREKLIEILKRGGEAFPVSTADHLLANGVTLADTNVGKWIPVTERLPDGRYDVLVSRIWWNERQTPIIGW